jgi:hypothetical protein
MDIQIGTRATKQVGSDRYPYEVIGMTASKKTLTLRELKPVHVSGNFRSGDAVYTFAQDPSGPIITARLSAKHKAFRTDSCFVYIGEANYYQDPNF